MVVVKYIGVVLSFNLPNIKNETVSTDIFGSFQDYHFKTPALKHFTTVLPRVLPRIRAAWTFKGRAIFFAAQLGGLVRIFFKLKGMDNSHRSRTLFWAVLEFVTLMVLAIFFNQSSSIHVE